MRTDPAVRILSWNTIDPNTAALCRLADVFAVDRLAFVRKPRRWSEAVGTQGHVPTLVARFPLTLLCDWQDDGYEIVAIEQGDGAEMLGQSALPRRAAFVLGNEGGGVPASALALASRTVEIPQWGQCASLNVAVAGGIVLYEWARWWRADWPRSANACRKRHGLGRPGSRVASDA